jgi:hypothetical protein
MPKTGKPSKRGGPSGWHGMASWWKLWAKALGEKASPDNKEADAVAAIRTSIVAIYIVTNLFIIAGIIRHWNN